MRKVSYGGTSGDYDSQLDASGKWTTTVPIISLDEPNDIGDMGDVDSGNIRPKHRPSPRGLKDLKKPLGEDAAERLSKSLSNQGIGMSAGGRRAVSQGPNVFDRLANGGSRKSVISSSDQDYDSKSGGGGTFTKIKDLTKNLRTSRSSREEDVNVHSKSNGSGGNVIAPRNSMALFDGGSSNRRVPMSNLNKLNSPSRSSISSSTRSLHKSQDHVNMASKSSAVLSLNSASSPRSSRRSTSTMGNNFNNLWIWSMPLNINSSNINNQFVTPIIFYFS